MSLSLILCTAADETDEEPEWTAQYKAHVARHN
jgi:hypothetical protein